MSHPSPSSTIPAAPAGSWTGRLCMAAGLRRAGARVTTLGVAAAVLLAVTIGLRWQAAHDARGAMFDQLRLLPRGDVVKPLMLGYHHVAADLLWLNIVQVLGQRDVPPADYAWLAHALDVVTTLDPQYVYAYDVGGVVLSEYARRMDWSNALLQKGMAANPDAWRLPFQLGFNAFFHEQDYVRAADYMARAAVLPGRPAYVPELAARLYVEGREPALALQFLEAMIRQTEDRQLLAALARRKGEVTIERDVVLLTQAVQRYRARVGHVPMQWSDLVSSGDLATLPVEPFGGAYQWDAERDAVISTTHPSRLRLHRAPDAVLSALQE